MLITPLETSYKGYRFRSRTEARWAVFFNELRLEYTYESEGFVLDKGVCYLPDFKVTTPQGKTMWVEVKGDDVEADNKFDLFQKKLDYSARSVLVHGDPYSYLGLNEDSWKSKRSVCPRCGLPNVDGSWDDFMCYHCDMETDSGGGLPMERGVLGRMVQPHKGLILLDDGLSWAKTLYGAATVARRARFEHGEKG